MKLDRRSVLKMIAGATAAKALGLKVPEIDPPMYYTSASAWFLMESPKIPVVYYRMIEAANESFIHMTYAVGSSAFKEPFEDGTAIARFSKNSAES